jgi:hypothetical protein
MRTLVAFSGGLDSTYVLWKLLTTTTDEITAVHLDIRYLENEYGVGHPPVAPYAENSTNAVVRWLKANTRSFAFETVNCYEFGADETVEVWLVRNYIASKLNSGEADQVVFGLGQIPYATRVIQGRSSDLMKLPTSAHATYRAFKDVVSRGKCVMYYDKNGIGRGEAMAELPSALFSLTLSCTKPNFISDGSTTNCGKCSKCIDNQFVRSKLDSGMSAAQTTVERNADSKNGTTGNYRLKFLTTGGIWAHISSTDPEPTFD